MAYIMLYGKPVLVHEIYTVESGFFRRCYSFKGVIPIKIKSRSLAIVLDYCKYRAQMKDDGSSWDFEEYFYSGILETQDDLIDLIHTAGRLDIKSLFDMLFKPVVRNISLKTPEEIGKIFKVRYNGTDQRLVLMNRVLDCAPPFPPEMVEEEMNFDREEILKVSPADFKKLLYQQLRYWVYAHLVIKRNPAVFIATKQLSKEEEESEEEEESKPESSKPESSKQEEEDDEESKPESSKEEEEEEEEEVVPKNDYDDGGSGPKGVAWTRRQQFDG